MTAKYATILTLGTVSRLEPTSTAATFSERQKLCNTGGRKSAALYVRSYRRRTEPILGGWSEWPTQPRLYRPQQECKM